MSNTKELIVEKRKKTKRSLTKKRLEIQKIKSESGKLGEETVATIPDDLEVMFAGKMALELIESKVRLGNMKFAFEKHYTVPKDVLDRIDNMIEEYEGSFKEVKERCIVVTERHPLWERMKGIKGFTAYQLAILMSLIKDPGKFETPNHLCVYAGVASIGGHAISKAKINVIKEIYAEKGQEFKGFNTKLSGRMFVVVDSILKQKGYFYEMYLRLRDRIAKRMIANEEVELVKGKILVKGRKNQSIEAATYTNAKRRIQRTLLHLLWAEWRKLKGLPIRSPYPIEYLGHTSEITLEEVKAFDAKV